MDSFMPTIHLIRHGQASSGKEDYDQLTDLGFQQADRLGQVFKSRGIRFDSTIVGGMKRHRQTAESCLAHIEQNPDITNSEWNEYDHQDILRQLRPEFLTAESTNEFIAGQSKPKLVFEQCFNDAIDRWSSGEFDSDYTETWQNFTGRVFSAFDQAVAQAREGQDLAVFTSGGPISLVCQKLLGIDAKQIMRLNWTLLNCGVSKLVVTKNRVFIGSMNEHTHIEQQDLKRFITYS